MTLRKEINKILESTILPEGISNEEMKEKLLPLSKHILENIPSKLFRNRPCSEMNIDAFNEDKLYAVTPDKFNDPYDSLFRYDKEGLRKAVLSSVIKEFLSNSIDNLTDEAVKSVKQLAYIACFSETIHSVTMWSHYADSHKGFALEYDSSVFRLKCQSCDKIGQCKQAAICNIYPVIYHRQRFDATDYLAWYIGRGLGMPMKNPDTSTALTLGSASVVH